MEALFSSPLSRSDIFSRISFGPYLEPLFLFAFPRKSVTFCRFRNQEISLLFFSLAVIATCCCAFSERELISFAPHIIPSRSFATVVLRVRSIGDYYVFFTYLSLLWFLCVDEHFILTDRWSFLYIFVQNNKRHVPE